MVPEDDFNDDPTKGKVNNTYRLLEVDNRVLLPIKTHIRVLVTSSDVLHCWAVPSFGVKIDSCPGRLNQTTIFLKRIGTYYGQCSEICCRLDLFNSLEKIMLNFLLIFLLGYKTLSQELKSKTVKQLSKKC
jgi:hypothetical protein